MRLNSNVMRPAATTTKAREPGRRALHIPCAHPLPLLEYAPSAQLRRHTQLTTAHCLAPRCTNENPATPTQFTHFLGHLGARRAVVDLLLNPIWITSPRATAQKPLIVVPVTHNLSFKPTWLTLCLFSPIRHAA